MQTEDYILQDSGAARFLLPKKHVLAIGITVFTACSLYFLVTSGAFSFSSKSTVVSGAYEGDSSVFEEIIDPTLSLTDVLLAGKTSGTPATSRDVRLAEGDNTEVYTRPDESLENYDDTDAALGIGESSEIDQEIDALAASDGISPGELRPYGRQWVTQVVEKGDTLSSVFSDLNIPYIILQRIADNKVTGSSITNLRPGNKLYFTFDDQNNLLGFVEQINGDEQWHFSRENAEQKEFTVTREFHGAHIQMIDSNGNISTGFNNGETPAYKKRGRLVVATIDKGESFSVAAHDAGLTYSEIKQITDLFKGRVQFSRHIQPGDTIRVLFSEDKGAGKINAVELSLKKAGTLSAFRNVTNDKYYDERGYNAGTSTFRRFPIDGKVIISSHFNPTRRHPVTGKVRPHNGTDFAVRVGTPVLSPADGVVEIAKYSRSAGYYIMIRHRGNYSTVYMHLSKLNVKPGQSVRIGEVIARSGNTGISTGPHLHYELRHNNKPINAMRVTLPANEDIAVSGKNRIRFNNNVALFKKELYQEDLITQN